jgi:hypothetical protein
MAISMSLTQRFDFTAGAAFSRDYAPGVKIIAAESRSYTIDL